MKSLGDKLGLAESTISLYELGKRQPDNEKLVKLSEVLGVSIDYLLERIDEPQEYAREITPLQNRLRELRQEIGWKQDDLAKLLSVERAAISKLETGKTPLTDERIIFLCDYFNVSADYLLGRTDKPQETSDLPLSSEQKALISSLSDEHLREVFAFAAYLRSKQD